MENFISESQRAVDFEATYFLIEQLFLSSLETACYSMKHGLCNYIVWFSRREGNRFGSVFIKIHPTLFLFYVGRKNRALCTDKTLSPFLFCDQSGKNVSHKKYTDLVLLVVKPFLCFKGYLSLKSFILWQRPLVFFFGNM